ncbi:MAG: hypothetical protein Q9217_001064 [Psora testacea]
MKPLTELPVNHFGRNGIVEQRPDIWHDANPLPEALNDRAKATLTSSPSSIQSMLKNTTETGHVGQFPLKSSRKPQSAFRAPPAGTARGSTRSSRLPENDGHLNVHYDCRPSSGLSRRDTMGSSAVSSIPSYGTRNNRDPPGHPSIEEYRSYSMSQSSYLSHSLANRHPCLNGSYQVRGVGQDRRPRSPFAYPARLKRPGYRPSSPALSDSNRPAYQPRPNPRPVSPTALYSMNPLPASWQPNFSHSDPSLRHCPPPHVKGPPQFQNPSAASSHPSTPRPASSLRSVASSSRLPRTQLSTQHMWTHPESPPPSPLFYDYTEAFEGLHHSQYTSMSTMNLNEPNALETGQDMHLQPGVRSREWASSELATKEVGSNSTPTKHCALPSSSLRLNIPQNTIAIPGQPEAEEASMDLKDSQFASTGTSASVEEVNITGEAYDGHSTSAFATSTTPSTTQPVHTPAETHRQGTAIAKSTGVHNDIAKSRDSDNSRGSPSSSIDSIRTAESNFYSEQGDFLINSTPTIPGPLPPKQPETPVLGHAKDRRANSYVYTQQEPFRATANEGQSLSEHSDIVSPTPERSITSPSSRDRFSKILGLKDSLFDLEDVKESHQEKAATDKSDHKAPLRIRDSLVNNTTINTSILEEPGPEEEQELSAGLLNTFGQRLDQPTQPLFPSAATNLSPGRAIVSTSVPLKMRESPFPLQESKSKPAPSSSRDTAAEREASGPTRHSAAAKKYRQAQVVSSNAKPMLRIDKELPPVPKKQRSFVAITPPTEKRGPNHPFAFTSLSNERRADESIAEPEADTASLFQNSDVNDCLKPPPALKPNSPTDVDSETSSHRSRPWNNESMYPWSDQLPDLEMTIPQPAEEAPPPTERAFPRFKLRIQRASTSSTGTTRLTKRRPSSDETSSNKRNSGHEIIKAATFKRKAKPVAPGQDNSSHDIGNGLLHTRFVESFDPPPQITTIISSPTITLLPPSPGHEVRSFFSDDSSQARQKGSIRKRLSDFKARHSQTNSSDEVRGYDRGLLSSALGKSRASGRSSRQSHNTASAMSHVSQIKWMHSKVINKVRFWLHRGEDKVRGWGWRVRSRQDRSCALHADSSTGE